MTFTRSEDRYMGSTQWHNKYRRLSEKASNFPRLSFKRGQKDTKQRL